MPYKILTYEQIDRSAWAELVQTSATGTWFQTPEAYSFYENMPEIFRPFVVGAYSQQCSTDGHRQSDRAELFTPEGKGERLRGVCVGYVTVEKSPLKQFLTRRAIIIGGPALTDDCTEEEVETLMNGVKELMSERMNGAPIYIESRNFNDYSRWKDAFAAAGFEYKEHLNFHVDCRDKEVMWERLSENRKRQIKKGKPNPDNVLLTATGSQIEQSSSPVKGRDVSEADIREWYEILAELYRTKVKTPLWPVEFFIEAYRQGVGKFLLVKHEGKVIGGSMVVMSERVKELGNEGTVYEWFECGLNAEYKEQYPSVMATWAGITLAHETGCARYDMMGAGEPGVPYGVRDFKSEFGGKLVEHGRFLCVNKPMLYRLGKLGVRLLKALK